VDTQEEQEEVISKLNLDLEPPSSQSATQAETGKGKATVDHPSSDETPKLPADLIQHMCENESLCFRIILEQSEATAGREGNHGADPSRSVPAILSANPVLLHRVPDEAGEKEKDKKEMEMIESNQTHWEFYLAMYERIALACQKYSCIAEN
jgi:hypothetical protein